MEKRIAALVGLLGVSGALFVFSRTTTGALAIGNVMDAALGDRNNNPGNLRKSADKWQGLAVVQDDPRFFKFIHPKYGVRAIGKLLLTYDSRYGLRSVAGIINRWAPPSENDTASYIAQVSDSIGARPNDLINVRANLPGLAKAIIRHELGYVPYSDAEIAQWVNLS